MEWKRLKAELLTAGGVRVEGAPIDRYTSSSSAGPGAGGGGSVFFSDGNHRVRLSLNQKSPLTLIHQGDGDARLCRGDEVIVGKLEAIGLHCPRQAYITVTGSCSFQCRYCPVPSLEGRRKAPGEVVAMIEAVVDQIDAISITSGVHSTCEEEEDYICTEILPQLQRFHLPIGVSIYPTEKTPSRLHALEVAEVKFNIETATEELFSLNCPDLNRSAIWKALTDSVPLFGRGHVFSNLIVGLGESDQEVCAGIDELTRAGVIPCLRPLNPVAGLTGAERPTPERLIRLATYHARALEREHLDPNLALTMCTTCTGCDLVPGRDL
ncbi:radical SAM protein [Methanosphaerula subterraneus]|uniref:radical SAM protein n=1 Tax=Methanosphaerula subterraneus TaxID=3350244 RepID=UPI003F841FAB